MKVRDLVSPQRINPVIQLDAFDPQDILRSYVLTDETAALLVGDASSGGFLRRLLKRTAADRNSFVYVGNYGSGKSHMLAFVDSLLSRPDLWDLEKHPALTVVEELRNRPFLTVKIKLSDVRKELDRVVAEALRDRLAQLGIPNPFTDWWNAVSIVNRDYRDNPDFVAYLEQYDLSRTMWDRRFEDHDETLFPFAEGFLSARGVGVQLEVSAEKLVDKTLNALATHPDFGSESTLVLIIDELSDYVQSRSGSDRVADMVFLRGLGDSSFTKRFALIAAVQKDILDPQDPVLAPVREIIERILNRFEKRTIASQYLHAVVRERVLVKTPEQRELVSKLYFELRKTFPNLTQSEATFLDLYPVHPDVIDIFQRLIESLGNRSVLDFISKRVSDESFLDADASTTFLTPDRLLQPEPYGLRLEFEGRSHLKPLSEMLERVETQHMPSIKDRHREATRSAFAALVAYQAARLEPTVEELVHATMIASKSGQDAQLNYDLIDANFEKLVGFGALKIERGDQQKRVYKIVTDGGNDLIARVQRIKANIEPTDIRVAEALRQALASQLGLNTTDILFSGKDTPKKVEWTTHKLLRDGVVRFVSDPDALEVAIAESESWRFFILDAIPRREITDYRQVLGDQVGVWIPNQPNQAEIDVLRESAAFSQAMRDSQQSEPALTASLGQLKIQQVDGKVAELTRRIYFTEGQVERMGEPPLSAEPFFGGSASARLDTLIYKALEPLWVKRYPSAPRLSFVLQGTYIGTLIKEFIAKQTVTAPKPNLKNLLEGIAVQTIALEVGGEYRINPEAPALIEVEKMLKQADQKIGIAYSNILEKLAAPPFGYPTALTQVVIAAILAKGSGSLSAKGGMIYGLDNVESVDFGKAEFLKPTGLCREPATAARILNDLGLSQSTFNAIGTQNAVWSRARTHLEQLLPTRLRQDLSGLPFDSASLIAKLDEASATLMPAREIFLQHAADARAGFDALTDRYTEQSSLNNIVILARDLGELTQLASNLREKHKYIENARPELCADSRSELQARLARGFSDTKEATAWLADFDTFQEDYIGDYLQRHDDARGVGLSWESLEDLRFSALEAAKVFNRVKPPTDITTLEGKRRAGLQARCTKLKSSDLRLSPSCPHCDFQFEAASDPDALAIALKLEANQSLEVLAQTIREQRDVIERNLQANPVGPATKTFLESLLAGAGLEGLTEHTARELDKLLDKEWRFEGFSLSTFRSKLEHRLSGQTLGWSEFSQAVVATLDELKPDGVPSKIRVQVNE